MTESNRKKLCGLYVNETKDGKQYLSGKTQDGSLKFSVFLNGFKETANHPDWILYSEDLENIQPVEPKKFNLSPQSPNLEEMPF